MAAQQNFLVSPSRAGSPPETPLALTKTKIMTFGKNLMYGITIGLGNVSKTVQK